MKNMFQDYVAKRELAAFDSKITELCEAIVASGIEFDQFWSEHALPTILQASHASEDELIAEFFGPFRGMRSLFGAQQPAQSQPQAAPAQMPQPAAPALDPNDPNHPRQQKLARFQQKADQQIASIKQRFQVAMKDFLKAVTDDAKSENDPHMWQIAKSFHQKLMAAAQPVLDQFKLTARFGKASYTNQFAKEAGQMQQNKRSQTMDALRQKAQQRVAMQPPTMPNYTGNSIDDIIDDGW